MTDTNVFQFSQPGTFADPLTEVLRNGARALLAQAVEAEVAALLSGRPIASARQSGLCASITECRAGRILKTDFDEGNDEQKMQLPLIVYSASEN